MGGVLGGVREPRACYCHCGLSARTPRAMPRVCYHRGCSAPPRRALASRQLTITVVAVTPAMAPAMNGCAAASDASSASAGG